LRITSEIAGENASAQNISTELASQEQMATNRAQSQMLIAEAARLLTSGKILALKGLGGYHLACLATDEAAVNRLRKRKHRPDKPLACMFPDLAAVSEICHLNVQEEELLLSAAAPIVLLKRRPDAAVQLASSVTPHLDELGVMLPYTPLHHLLMDACRGILVMTSGNLSEEPIVGDNSEAHERLAKVVDVFLDHDRPIRSRYDDSVLRVVSGRQTMIRRARGYAPTPLPLPEACLSPKSLLAVGAEQKNTFCLTRGREAFVSQHLGELDDVQALTNWDATRALYEGLFQIDPELLAADLHPEYLSSKWAQQHASKLALPLAEIQHHFAHIAAILGEYSANHPEQAPQRVLGLAFDGTGLGDDGTIWGGEVLLASLTSYQRLSHLHPIRLPGGAGAILNPSRIAYSWLKELDLLQHPGAAEFLDELGEEACRQLDGMIEKEINSPLCSSMGRLFDAVSALLDICRHPSYDGQAAIELEASMRTKRGRFFYVSDSKSGINCPLGQDIKEPSPFCPHRSPDYYFELGDCFDPQPIFKAILDDLVSERPVSEIAHDFHEAVVELICRLSERFCSEHNLKHVALGGGVFMNKYLLQSSLQRLESLNLDVLLNEQLPCNDGCISYGQAVVALARQKIR
jgi:hydrogenase maturation protein HypF